MRGRNTKVEAKSFPSNSGSLETLCIVPSLNNIETIFPMYLKVPSVKCWDSNSMGMRGYVKEGLELALMGSFDTEQGGCQLWT